MPAVVADTHALVWYLAEPSRLSPAAVKAFQQAVQQNELIYFSSISLIELFYLTEKGRLPSAVIERLLVALHLPDTSLELVPLNLAISLAVGTIPREAVSDPSDRIIAATAAEMGLPLITRDRKIRLSGLHTIW